MNASLLIALCQVCDRYGRLLFQFAWQRVSEKIIIMLNTHLNYASVPSVDAPSMIIYTTLGCNISAIDLSLSAIVLRSLK